MKAIHSLTGPGKAVLYVGLILCAAFFAAMLNNVYAFGVDDSYIFFRYAENLSSGNGFVFNAGEPSGEGFTSWLWLLLLAACRFIGFNMIAASKLMGILFHLASVGLLFLIVRRLTRESRVSLFTSAFIAGALLLEYRLIAHSVSGMETSLYLFSILLLVYLTTLAIQASESTEKWWLILSGMTTALFLVRPEGIAAGGFSLLALAAVRRRDLLKPIVWKYLTVGLILPLALFIGLKLMIFGYALPHSYYHKFIGNASRDSAALKHLLLFLKSCWWLGVGAVLSVAYEMIGQKKTKTVFITKPVIIYYGLLCGFMMTVYLFFHPVMNYLHRFYIPYLPLLLLLMVPAIRGLFEYLSALKRETLRLIPVLPLLALFVFGLNVPLESTRRVINGWSDMVNPQVYRAKLGKLMKDLPSDTVVANTEMGVIPYFSGLTCIDMAGLTDPHIAHHGLSMEYLEERNVRLILFPRDVEKLTADQWEEFSFNYKDVFQSERFRKDFQLIGSYAAWPGGVNRYYLYADRTAPEFASIKQWRDKLVGEFAALVLPTPFPPAP